MLDEALKSRYYTIVNNYQKVPWEDIVVEGVCGKGLLTGFEVETINSTPEHPQYKIAQMGFDDTIALLGDGLVSMICRLPHGPEVH